MDYEKEIKLLQKEIKTLTKKVKKAEEMFIEYVKQEVNYGRVSGDNQSRRITQ